MELLLRFLAGGSLVVLVSLLGKSRHPQLAGLAVLFPAVTLVGYAFLLAEQGREAVRPVVLCSLLGVPTVLFFLLALYVSLKYLNPCVSLLVAVGAWLLSALAVLAVAGKVA